MPGPYLLKIAAGYPPKYYSVTGGPSRKIVLPPGQAITGSDFIVTKRARPVIFTDVVARQ